MDFRGAGVLTKQVFTEHPADPRDVSVNNRDMAPAFMESTV